MKTNISPKPLSLLAALLLLPFTASAQSLMLRYSNNPVFTVGANQPTWRNQHVANVDIFTPAESKDGRWRLWLRGTGNGHDQIGTFDQAASAFNPYGPWTEYSNNPVLRNGSTYDSQHLLDVAAAAGPNKEVLLYYMGRNASNQASLNGAISTDGGFTFTKFSNNPLKMDVGPNDAVYANGKYYVFYGDAKWNGSGFNEPLQIWLSQSASANAISSPAYALKVGPAGSFDSYSVNGAKLFRVSGDSRWFMVYQCSSKNFDYPERFHVAYSSDLVNWTKVNNSTPFFLRGDAGEWDQGAIWTSSVFEHNSRLYIYYEGWGSYGPADRDAVYYGGGQSRVGVATCSVSEFLGWVGGNTAAKGVVNWSFEASGATQTPSGWGTWPGGNGANADADFTETGGHSGTYRCTHYKASAYEVYTDQLVTGLANGTYTLSAWVVGGGGQNAAFMSAKAYGSGVPELKTDVVQSGWPNWTKISIPNINVSNGQCHIGFYTNAPGGKWLSFDDVTLTRTSARVGLVEATRDDAEKKVLFHPNPAAGELNLTYWATQAGPAQIQFTDALSRICLNQQHQAQKGRNQVKVSTQGLPGGTYLVSIHAAGERLAKPVIINQ